MKRNGLSFAEEETMVNYQNFGFVQSSYPAYRNVIDNIRAPEPSEIIRINRRKFLRPQQKPILLLKELISRFSQPGDFVVDLFAGTFTTARTCFSLTQHRVFIGSEIDNHCRKLVAKKTIDAFANVVHLKQSDFILNLNESEASACDTLVQHLSTTIPRPPPPPVFDCWTPPSDLPIYQCIPRKTLSTVASYTQNTAFIHQLHIHPENWPRSLWLDFNHIDPHILLMAEASSCSLVAAPSTIKHPDAGMGVFATRPFLVGDVICNYYGTLLYHPLPYHTDTRKEYGSGMFRVTASRFKTYAIKVAVNGTQLNKVRTADGSNKTMFIVSAPFNIGSYINEWFYLEGDLQRKDFLDKTIRNPRSESVKFVQRPAVCKFVEDVVAPNIIQIIAKKDINRGDELFADYMKSD